MATRETFEWQNQWLNGEGVAYPGHPVVLATMVMERYESLEHATRLEDGRNFGNALSDSFIPGSGCAVSCALDVLKLAQGGQQAQALERAQRYWDGYAEQSPRNAKNVAEGLAQADLVMPRFEALLAGWTGPQDLGSPFRV